MLSFERPGSEMGGQQAVWERVFCRVGLPPQQAPKKFEQTCEKPMAAASRPRGQGRFAEDRALGGRRAGRRAGGRWRRRRRRKRGGGKRCNAMRYDGGYG